jgi:MYXO-CTERM domain-containing protein
MKIFLTSVATCVLLGDAALADTFHVATTGSDAAPGTSEAPFRTIQRASNAVAPGDSVVIHAGTYTGFTVSAHGAETAPIAFTGDGVVNIDGAATADRDAVHIEGASWVRIEGLTVTGATRAGISALDCDHITVRNNHVDANGRWGVFSSFCDDFVVEGNEVSRSGTEHGIYASNSADRPVMRNNRIWGNGMCGIHMNGDINYGGDGVISGAIVENNVIYDNGHKGGSAINGDGVANSVIRNNVLDGNHASGISLYRIDGGAPSTGNQIINNTVRMASDARWAVNIQDGSGGNVLRNNILLNAAAGNGAIDLCAACATGMVSDHNAVVGRFSVGGTVVDLAGWRDRTGTDASSFVATAAALFTDAAAGDLTLRADSPAIDQGVADGAPATDLVGTLRPQGTAIDIGAFEHCDGPCTGSDPGDGGGSGSGGGSGDGSGSGDGTGDGDGSGPPFSGPAMPEAGGCSAVDPAAGALVWLAIGGLAVRRRRRPMR